MKTLLLLLGALLPCPARDWHDIEFARPGGQTLTLDAWVPDTPWRGGAVILVHGGGWEAGDKRSYIGPWFTTLRAAGIPWFTINYRLAPQHVHPAAVEDLETAVAWVQGRAKEFGIDPQRLVLMGESAGGHLVALAALRGKIRVAGLVSFYGIHDILAWRSQRGALPRNIALYLPRASDEQLREASPVAYVTKSSPPVWLVHGDADTGVPWQQSQLFCDALQRVGGRCEMQVIPGAPHGVENWEKDPRFQVWKKPTVERLRRWLRPAAR